MNLTTLTALTTEPRYAALERRDGFILDGGPGRVPCRVTLGPTGWQVEADGTVRTFGLFEARPLVELITHLSMRHWQPRAGDGAWRLRAWAVRQAARSVGWVVGSQRRRLLDRVDPVVLRVQRAVFAATCGAGSLVLADGFYPAAGEYLLGDVVRYRAAAVAVRGVGERVYDGYLDPTRPGGALLPGTAAVAACRRLSDWRGLFSDTGAAYGHLNRTLDRLPGGVSHWLLPGLAHGHLERTITDRVELVVYLLGLEHRNPTNRRLFQFASRTEIARAVARVGVALGQDLRLRRTADLRRFVGYLADYPDQHPGAITGLADRAIRWHRETIGERAAEAVAEYGGDALVASPPVPPPAVPGLVFLDTVGAICREGAAMNHCMAVYVPEALAGRSFLFHYESDGAAASAEVGGDGRVRQSVGPANADTAAARVLARILRAWGRTFPHVRRADADVPF